MKVKELEEQGFLIISMDEALKTIPVGDIFRLENDERVFKICQRDDFVFYVYGFLRKNKTSSEITFRLDYTEASRLAENFEISIISSKIINIVDDLLVFSSMDRNLFKNRFGIYPVNGKKYIAEATIRWEKIPYPELIRTASSSMDNIQPGFMSYAPDIACKRAVIKCIIDVLHLKDVVEDFYEKVEEEKTIEEKINEKPAPEPITEAQLNMIKTLLGKKFKEEKYKYMTSNQAKEVLEKLSKKEKSKKKK